MYHKISLHTQNGEVFIKIIIYQGSDDAIQRYQRQLHSKRQSVKVNLLSFSILNRVALTLETTLLLSFIQQLKK